MKIYVDTEDQKKKLLAESEYIHYFVESFKDSNGKLRTIGLDSDKAGTLMHIYMNPDIIVVRP